MLPQFVHEVRAKQAVPGGCVCPSCCKTTQSRAWRSLARAAACAEDGVARGIRG